MLIQQYQLSMQYTVKSTVQERSTETRLPPQQTRPVSPESVRSPQSDQAPSLEASGTRLVALYQQNGQQVSSSSNLSVTGDAKATEAISNNESADIRFIRLLLEKLRGVRFAPFNQEGFTLSGTSPSSTSSPGPETNAIARMNLSVESPIEESETSRTPEIRTLRKTERTEHLSHQLTGGLAITLENGEQFNLNIGTSLAQASRKQEFSQLLINGKSVDPLILRFNNSDIRLSHQTVDFDLNADGQTENFSYATVNSAFLALDKNDNGIIDDGGELFGAKNGDGFADLRQYDSNQDGLIDERDPVFAELKLSYVDAERNYQLERLDSRSVTTIFLDAIDSSYTQQNGNGEAQGLVRKTGLFLDSNREAGLIQHLDIYV